jgi:hypothetical protein
MEGQDPESGKQVIFFCQQLKYCLTRGDSSGIIVKLAYRKRKGKGEANLENDTERNAQTIRKD